MVEELETQETSSQRTLQTYLSLLLSVKQSHIRVDDTETRQVIWRSTDGQEFHTGYDTGLGSRGFKLEIY